MKALKLLTTGIFLLGTSILLAQTLPARGPISFSVYDTDNNNVITKKEFNLIKEKRMLQNAQLGKMMKNQSNSANFSDIDTNLDGIITTKELQIHQDKRFNNRMNQKKGTGRNQNW